jgi:hypothetical protein
MNNEEKARACLVRTVIRDAKDPKDLADLEFSEIVSVYPATVVRAMVQFALEHANEAVERKQAAEAEVVRLRKVIADHRAPLCFVCGESGCVPENHARNEIEEAIRL